MSESRHRGVVAALLAGVAAVGGSFGIAGFTPLFVVGTVASWVTSLAPGMAVTVAITELGGVAQGTAFLGATLLTVLLYAAVAGAALVAGRSSEVPYTPAMVGTAVAWLLGVVLVGRLGTAALVPAAGVGAVLAGAERRWHLAGERPTRAGRRGVLRAVGAVAGLVGAAGLRGRTITGVETGPLSDVVDESVEAAAEERLAAAEERSLAVEGTDGLVSESFYRVDLNSVDPTPTAGRWSLSVTGAVDQPLELSYADLLDRELEHRFVTLRCVGEGRNGQKMDTALWTGVPVEALLDEAGVASGCECVMLRSTDGYYMEFPLAALRPGLLAFGMNGELLPRAHGYPVRALVPGHWGEVNVKWLSEIELLEQPAEGYWEKRGWHGDGPVKTVAKLHGVEHREDRVVVGGHAYAGTRGVSAVEVSTDGGDTWNAAELSDPLPGWGDRERAQDAWRGWRYAFTPERPAHEVVVRAVEADGTVQPREETGPYPDGPSGWVRRTVER